MAKTKRKHLAALDAMEKQTPLMHHDVRSYTGVESHRPRKGRPPKLKQSAPPSSASLPRHQQTDVCQTEEGEGDPTAEVSHPSFSPVAARDNVEQNVAPVAPSSPYLQQQGDDSDTDSWVDVRKQKVVIIIPSRPTAKPRFLKTKQQVQWDGRNRAKARVAKAQKNVYTTEMYNKSTENNAQRSSTRQLQESICAGAPPISSMDILLASALDTEHTICTPRQGRKRHRAATDIQEAASLDTADSSAQPKSSSLKGRKGLKAIGQSKEVAQGHTKKRRIALCKSTQPKMGMGRKGKKTQQATSKANDVPGLGVRPDAVDSGENKLKQNGANFAVLSCNEALKILMLKKHLEKAGGLRSWLCSVGLGQFKEAFEKRRWSEGDLLQLQMDDLKRMGKDAVGPRRKLIWAINHFSHQLV